MNNKFLDKVVDQILSETRIIGGKVHTPFFPSPLFFLTSPPHLLSLPLLFFSSHCKKVYSLNEQEIDYVWVKYKEGLTTLIDKKELTHQEKG